MDGTRRALLTGAAAALSASQALAQAPAPAVTGPGEEIEASLRHLREAGATVEVAR